MTTALAKTNGNHHVTKRAPDEPLDAEIIERVLVVGDLRQLTPDERVRYYLATCKSVGLNPMTKPFEYITLNSKLTLYATKNCTDQLREKHEVSITRLDRVVSDGLSVVTAHARTSSGREDEDLGAVNITNLKGESLANAMMKACTKAKRRVTLSICGLSFVDETELETIPTARRVEVDHSTGEIREPANAPPSAPSLDDTIAVAAELEMKLRAATSMDERDTVVKLLMKALKTKAILKEQFDVLQRMAVEKKKELEGESAPPVSE